MNDKHCIGCGVKLQDENMLLDGYTSNIENDICTRCFRLKNYGEFQIVTRSNEEYIEILKSVNETKDLVLYIIDLLNIENDINMIREYINNKIILVINKRDVLPRSIKDEKIKEYFEATGLEYHDIITTSFNKNYNVDELYMMIKKYKSSKNVYIVGRTNVGKSTLVNTLIKNYSDNEASLTISALPSTTLNKISVKLSEDLTLVDTPGLIDRGNIINYVNESMYKNIMPKKEIKPKTFQIKSGQCLVIDNLFRIDYVEGEKNSFTVFVSNNLKVKRRNAKKNETLKDLAVSNHEVGYHQDVVINGLGFIKIVEKAKVSVHIDRNVEVFVRDSLI
jgi:Predicted GTPases